MTATIDPPAYQPRPLGFGNALKSGSTVWGWGDNTYGQIGLGR